MTFGKSIKFYSVFQWKSGHLRVFRENTVIPRKLTESNLFKGLFCQRCVKWPKGDIIDTFLVTFWQKVTRLGWFNEGYGTVFFRQEKSVKQSLFRSQDFRNSTTGCEDLPGAPESVRKSTKSDPFLSLSDQFCQLLTISMVKSSPFGKQLKYRSWDSCTKQSI